MITTSLYLFSLLFLLFVTKTKSTPPYFRQCALSNQINFWYGSLFPIIYINTVWFQFLHRINAAFGVSNKFVPYRLPNNNLGYKTYEINLSAVTISKAGSGVYWYKISVSSDFSKVVSVSLTDGKEIPNKRSFMPYIENGTGGAQAIGFLIADPDAPTTMTFNNGAYMSLTAFGYLK